MNGLFISGIEFTRQGIYTHLWVYSIRVHSILTTYQLIVMAPPCMIRYRLIKRSVTPYTASLHKYMLSIWSNK